MDCAMPKKRLAQLLDQVVREVTEREAGIRLQVGAGEPSGEVCTVYTSFRRGYQTVLSLCAERSLFTRLTRGMMQEDEVSAQDVEDFSKEYFNVLCGRIVSLMYPETKVAARFELPAFCEGRREPQGRGEQLSIQYTSEGAGSAELVWHMQEPAADVQPG